VAGKPVVEVLGLKELRRDLVRLDKESAPKAFVEAGQSVANPLASQIRGALPKDTGDLTSTVRVAKVRTGASLRVGTARTPYVGPTEFGAYPGAREFVPGGRYIYPAARAMAQQGAEAYAKAMQKAIDDNGWWTP
jgi:hypothetical protein